MAGDAANLTLGNSQVQREVDSLSIVRIARIPTPGEARSAACCGQPVKNCEQEKVEQDVHTPRSLANIVNVAAPILISSFRYLS